MRDQDPSKTSSRLTRMLSMRRIRLRTNRARALIKMLPHPQSHSTNAPFTHSIWTPYLDQHQVCRISYSTGRAQLFRRQCVWVKTLQGLAFLRRLEHPVGFPSYYGRPIVTTVWTILPYRFDSSFIPFTRINNQRYSCHPDNFSSSQSEAVRGVRTGREDHQEGGQARRVTSSVYACE
jgi:hypothetical protein